MAPPRRVPSSAGLPDSWTREMDEFICYSDALGDLPLKVIIVSLKKRFPHLNPYAISEVAIERRLFCLERMDNDYFKKGSAIAVQRLESAGIRLPPEPDYEKEAAAKKATAAEPVTPVKQSTSQVPTVRVLNRNNNESKGSLTARYHHDHYVNPMAKEPSASIAGRISSDTTQNPTRAESTIGTAASEKTDMKMPVVSAGNASTNLRSTNNSSRRPKDANPAASLDHLRLSDDISQPGRSDSLSGQSSSTLGSNVYPFGAKGKSNVPPLSQISTVNPSLGFSAGSPRAARIRPVGSSSNVGAGRRLNDENIPLSISIPSNPATEKEGPAYSSRRYL
ncbi:MAG: hypothetical protein L6R41_001094 [Letrouitia leprolyta]|nr:MAG: hypothetical protein L6R41_001094 [Letrouitia leprolyta]